MQSAYQAAGRTRCRRGASAFGVIACVLLLATIPLDHVRFPQLAATLLPLRLAGVATLGAIVGLLQSAFGRRYPRALGVVVACGAGAVVEALVFTTGGEASPVNVGLILVLLGVALLIPWPPAWSALVCAVVVAGWVGSALVLAGVAVSFRFVDNLLVLGATSGLAVVTTAMLERRRWSGFASAWALGESEARLKTVIANAPVVLFAMDRAGVFTFSDGKGLARIGRAPGELVGRHFSEVVSAGRPYEPRDQELLERAQGGEAVTWVGSVGEAVFECRMAPFRNARGDITPASLRIAE